MTKPKASREKETARGETARWELLRRIGHWLDVPMAVLSLVWVLLLALELADALPPGLSDDVYLLDSLIWVIFLLHFLLEFAIAPSKTRYLKSNWLTAVSVALPFLRAIRLLRVVRFLRTLSLARILLSANRATRSAAAILSEHRFGYVVTVVGVLGLLGASGVYFFEQDSPGSPFHDYGEAIWWAATMITTINVGAEPVTLEGRVIAFLLRIIGLALFSYVTASIASYFVRERGGEREQPNQAELQELNRLLRRLLEEARAHGRTGRDQSEREDTS